MTDREQLEQHPAMVMASECLTKLKAARLPEANPLLQLVWTYLESLDDEAGQLEADLKAEARRLMAADPALAVMMVCEDYEGVRQELKEAAPEEKQQVLTANLDLLKESMDRQESHEEVARMLADNLMCAMEHRYNYVPPRR